MEGAEGRTVLDRPPAVPYVQTRYTYLKSRADSTSGAKRCHHHPGARTSRPVPRPAATRCGGRPVRRVAAQRSAAVRSSAVPVCARCLIPLSPDPTDPAADLILQSSAHLRPASHGHSGVPELASAAGGCRP